MSNKREIKNVLISVFNKDGLSPIIHKLNELSVKIFSTGGTKEFIEKEGVNVTAVENLTTFPSILGGRVKTLHPKIFEEFYREEILLRMKNNYKNMIYLNLI